MATVRFDGASVQYPGAERPSVSALDLDIADGEFVVLVGPSGCGKSTSLRALAGLEAVTDGRILIDDVDVTAVSPKKRDVAMVFQNYALYPNMTVAQNMGFALRNAGVSKEDTAKQVNEAAAMLELEPLLDRKPARLSGGQRQRVAMGRAIVRHPKVFAMDEPLSNLDARLRVSTRSQISALQRRLGVTTLYVTHDQVEAMTMGDRVAVLKDGLLQQVAPPRELYDDPVNTFVAGFLGSPGMNLVTVQRDSDGAKLAGATVAVPRTVGGETLTVGLRPESLDVVSPDAAGAARGTVQLVEELGAEALVYVAVDGQDKQLVARVDRASSLRPGDAAGLIPAPDQALFFHAESGDRLR
ncbi:ABC transporter related protein OS=Tsukamurella paurometabola (strain ATCC 8368 / DSM / CCUG 35730 / CIP 100753 / JCM 10117 / KCTC 9821 / NBRC 16120 / NCIMB 702349 / NCTC 13040) OX=521096 GN=Tpau_3526 PE=4 SV=1 [Tsukamurella paurometabola]|uniref:Trehalose import ATP-binding protein SugC n=1 Tax=Tsukamurella paurometabola (strain ATCC 8368 / DSM 20162 / CCUG 35730 / CIP 100753 / JCM 10117 / KCTC 9821 / NBRC 16120 / NCIMB 702349 / NCTC 13040) TaxID=521096 RepID=D5UX86_TSUPD|nr:sn-glycerol-3-phosphate ABC transporter ATP-binding protein UgpC [Tsukamurella paurometabola]ADG80105.1 ABC transporter related protein [Tsukamurella paurometabola DSM 20162]SUP38439.1 sn-glycerol-3-phosphate import ATP-binding protein UgpC [Tsukamurella paurometabola]